MVRVQDVVSQYMIEKGYDSQHQRSRLLNIAISGLKELHYDVTGEPVFDQLTLDNNYTAAVPTGLIQVIGMWINVNGYGFLEIVESDKLPTNIVDSQGNVEEAERSNIDDNYFRDLGYYDNPGSYFQGGEFTGRIYSGVDPNPFKYRLNTATNKFEFSSNVRNPILEYLGTLGTSGGKHVIPEMAVDALIAWLRYAENRNRPISPAEKDYNQRMWVAAKNLVLRRMDKTTPANMREAFRSAYSLSTK